MRALQLVGDRDLRQVEIEDVPAPGPGEVTLKVAAVALNHIDVWGWRGMAFAKRKMPLTVGAEASGVVEAIGPGVSSLLPGQLVSIYGARTCGLCKACREGRDNLCEHVSGVHGFHLDGFACERVNLPARLLVPAPPGCDAIGAALAPVTFGTVEHMLFDNARLEPGETILVHAGGSGIGTAAIQLAKRHGATVITTVGSDEKIEPARALGADAFLMLTDVDAVYEGWGTVDRRPIRKVTPAELTSDVFAAGSMRPKVEAACDFANAGGIAGIGRLEDARGILEGRQGTLVTLQAINPAS